MDGTALGSVCGSAWRHRPSYEFREVTVGMLPVVITSLKRVGSRRRVVVNGAFTIDAAAQLNNMASMMNRNVRETGMAAAVPDHTAHTPEAFSKQLMNVVGQLPVSEGRAGRF